MQGNPLNASTQCDIGALLEACGARISGHNRADCPVCKRCRSVSYTESVFCCHGIGCGFRGGIGKLRSRLGIRREWLPPAEYRELCRRRELAHEAAERLAAAVHSRFMVLLDWLRDVNRLQALAHDAGASEPSWESLALAYADGPAILAELGILEFASVADLLRLLTAGAVARERVFDRVLYAGGLYDASGRWVEVLA
jgi:hypothetical protein